MRGVFQHSGAGRRYVLAALLLALTGVSCGSVPRTSYYTLHVPAPPAARDPRTALVLGVEHFRATEALRDDRIVYYVSPTQINFYQYHRWSADPATILTALAARRLDQAGAFAAVRRLPSRDPVDYVVRGQLLNFEEVDFESGVRARVAVELALVRSRDRRTFWSGYRQSESAVQGKGVPAVVEAINAASVRVMDELMPELVAQVERDAQQNSKPSP